MNSHIPENVKHDLYKNALTSSVKYWVDLESKNGIFMDNAQEKIINELFDMLVKNNPSTLKDLKLEIVNNLKPITKKYQLW